MTGESSHGQLKLTVADHYNKLEQKSVEARRESRIFHLRNFNNWVKSVLISEAIYSLRGEIPGRSMHVLDLCCGKGGDLRKWSIGRVNKVICVDMAENSVKQAEDRYKEMQNSRFRSELFESKFHVADCADVRLKDIFNDKDQTFDLVSCQFSFHYSFETYERARTMLRNACERLKPGGRFIGTIPDCFEIVKRLEQSSGLQFGNDIFSVTFDSKTSRPLFGDKYHFYLDEVVDCPEFLVYFPLLEEMAREFGMKRVFRYTFQEFFEKYSAKQCHRDLAERLSIFEVYPSNDLTGSVEDGDYEVAQKEVDRLLTEKNIQNPLVGCISKSEWEVSSMYCAFCFKKESNRPQDDDRHTYNEKTTPAREEHSNDSKRKKQE